MFAIILISAIIGSSIFVYFYIVSPVIEDEPVFKGGTLFQDETWSGSIFVYAILSLSNLFVFTVQAR